MFFELWKILDVEPGGGPCACRSSASSTSELHRKFFGQLRTLISFVSLVSLCSHCGVLCGVNATKLLMWKRNVACLRSCSSATVSCGWRFPRGIEPYGRAQHAFRLSVQLSRCFSHAHDNLKQREDAIGDDEFLDALREVLPSCESNAKPGTIAIAVSGGVDSMALATMYARYGGAQLPNLHGFIIDHKARPGSTEEARWVAEQLSRRKDIIHIALRASTNRKQWASNRPSFHLPGLEILASKTIHASRPTPVDYDIKR